MANKLKSYLTRQTASYTIALCAAVALFMALSNLGFVASVLKSIVGVLSPFIYAFVLAFILNRPVMWFEKKIFASSKHKKFYSIICVYVISIVVVTGLLLAVIPQLGLSISYLIDTLPDMMRRLYRQAVVMFNEFHWSSQLIQQVESLWQMAINAITDFSITALPGVLNFSLSVGSGVVDLLMIIIISVYMLSGKDKLLMQFKKATYAFFSKEKADRMVEIANRSNNIFSGFIVGKMLDSLIIGILCFIGMLFINHDYTVLIAVIVGVTNMIPFFGPFIGAIPCLFILLMVNPMSAALFAVFVFLLQQFDGNILGPKILGDSLGLSPIWILAGILIGNGLFGIVGMLIGVPTFAVLYNIVSETITHRLQEKGMSANYSENKIEFNSQESTLCNSKEN